MNNAIERLARLGYGAIGIVYTIIGVFSAAAGLGGGGKTADRSDAVSFILHQPFGRFILLILAVGIAGYALWRLISGIRDTENRGTDAKGLAIRAGSALRGVAYGWVAFEVLRVGLRQTSGVSSSDAETRHWTGRVMDKPFGHWLIAMIGLYILGQGVYQLYRAWKSKLGKDVHIPRGTLTAISRFGLAARGVVFLVIGASLFFAGTRDDPGQARGTSGALSELASQPFGNHLLTLIGVGLVAYGVYAFLNARYRQITT
jgi:hypothetical protein